MRQIETAAGRMHPASMCGAAEGYLHITIEDGASFAAVVREFSDAEKTATITDCFGEMTVTHAGYTSLTVVQWEGGNTYHIILEHGAQE